VTLSSWSRTPAFRAGFRATFPARSAESPRDSNSAPTRGNTSVWPYSSTAFPAMRSRRAAVLKARDWSQTRSGFLGAQECWWILRDRTGIKQSRARSADRASRVANGSVRATFAPSDRAVSRRCHRDRPPKLSPVPAALVPGRNRRTVAGRYHRTDPGSSGGINKTPQCSSTR